MTSTKKSGKKDKAKTKSRGPQPKAPSVQELSEDQLKQVSGGLNPQPLPPGIDEEIKFALKLAPNAFKVI